MNPSELEGLSEQQLKTMLLELIQKNDSLERELHKKEALLNDATTNHISGLKNKNGYRHRLPEILKYKDNYSVIEMDTNLLKDMNDRFGHEQGDNYLRVQAKAVVEIIAKKMKLIEFDDKGNAAVPKNVHHGLESDQKYIEQAMAKVYQKDLFHIGGDEFRIIRKHKRKADNETDDQHVQAMLNSDHAFMAEVMNRFAHLWRLERSNAIDDHGVQCDVEASFGYGVASSSEPMLRGKTIKDVQRVADNRAFYHKAWQKLTGRVALPAGRSLEPLQEDRRLQGVENLGSLEELLQFVHNKEDLFSGKDRRTLLGSEGKAL